MNISTWYVPDLLEIDPSHIDVATKNIEVATTFKITHGTDVYMVILISIASSATVVAIKAIIECHLC